MAVRTTMASLIARTRLLINDTGTPAVFTDQDIQDVMDESRVDYKNAVLTPKPTFSGSLIQYLDYWSSLGGWEDGYTLKQYLVTPVTPATSEPIAGHWTFASSTLPPVYISGSLHDVYRAAADLLERWAAKYALSYNVVVDGQNLQRGQMTQALQALARTYRQKQRAYTITTRRTDIQNEAELMSAGLGPSPLDYMAGGS